MPAIETPEDGPTEADDGPKPFLECAGRFRDDPFRDEMQESIRRHRSEMDAEWDVPEPDAPADASKAALQETHDRFVQVHDFLRRP